MTTLCGQFVHEQICVKIDRKYFLKKSVMSFINVIIMWLARLQARKLLVQAQLIKFTNKKLSSAEFFVEYFFYYDGHKFDF